MNASELIKRAQQFPNGFKVTAPLPVDIRLVLTREEMKKMHSNSEYAMPEYYFCLCIDDHRIYAYNKNMSDEEAAASPNGKFTLAEDELQKATEQLRADLLAEVAARTETERNLNTAINREKERAQRAESTLTNSINTEASSRQAQDEILTNKITTEASERSAADNSLDEKISQEVTDRAAAVSNEKTRAEAVENRLSEKLDQEITDRKEAVRAEEIRAGGKEAALERAINTEISDRTTAIQEEKQRAEITETGLLSKINTEITDRETAVTLLTSRITTEETTRSTEVDALTRRIGNEETARANLAAAITEALTNEATARSDKDAELEQAIDDIIGGGSGSIHELSQRIDKEVNDRATADTALANAVGAEESARVAKDAELDEALEQETAERRAVDQGLSDRIDSIENRTDVVDIVGTKQDLLDYDTSKISDNDIIKVLVDETQEDATSYYRWLVNEESWEFVGKVESYPTKAEIAAALALKQNNLVSGSNIKTINEKSVLGEGNLSITEGALLITGAELEEGGYRPGQLYYCTSAVGSDNFKAGHTYVATGVDTISEIQSFAVDTNPMITSFSISPGSTELGDKKLCSYSYTLKKYTGISNLMLDGNLIVEHPESASGSGSVDTAYDSHTFTLSATGVGSKTATISPLYRHFIGPMASDDIDEIIGSLQDVISDTGSIKTYLSKPSSYVANIGDAPTYVYFIIKGTINSLSSSGWPVPYELVEANVTFTNHYNATYSVNVYRTANKIKGDLNFIIG